MSGSSSLADREIAWRGAAPAGILTLILALGLLTAPAATPESFMNIVGLIVMLAALIEAGVALANRARAEGRAALVLSASGVVAGALLFVRPADTPLSVVNTVILAIAVRGCGAAVAALRIRPVMRKLVLLRALADIGIALFLIITVPLALALTLPFTMLTSMFFGGEGAGPGAAALFGPTIGLSIAAGGAMLLLAGHCARRGRDPKD